MQVLLSLFYMSPIITDNTPPFTFYIIIKINNFPLINSKISISKHYFLQKFSVLKYYSKLLGPRWNRSGLRQQNPVLDVWTTLLELSLRRAHCPNRLPTVAVAAAAQMAAIAIEVEPPRAVWKFDVERNRPIETKVGVENIIPPITRSGQKELVAIRCCAAPAFHIVQGGPRASRIQE